MHEFELQLNENENPFEIKMKPPEIGLDNQCELTWVCNLHNLRDCFGRI